MPLPARRGALLAALWMIIAGPAAGQPGMVSRPPADPVRVEAATVLLDPAAGHARVTVPPAARQAARAIPGSAPEIAMLNRLAAQGRAAGFSEVLYDNRDGDHSRLDTALFPGLRETRYAPDLPRALQGRGVAGSILFDMPVLGNASLAVTSGPLARSMARLALTDQRAADTAYRLFRHNHLYVYPEHRDHDPDRGDLFLAQSPYLIVSQGSSFSDQPFLRALLLSYAALPPETFARLRAEGLLPATAQMILRRSLRPVRSDADYLSPSAHPTAFAADQLRPAAMVALAASMTADRIPPMVRLSVTQDLHAEPGVDYLAANLDETLFTTPGAIARAWRSFAPQRRLAVSAAGTRDPNGHPLRFAWVVLRGDPARVRIETGGANATAATITIDWHRPEDLSGPTGLAGQRVEIGVFAHNGFFWSAPAFISLALPVHQDRAYAGAGAAARLWSLDYRADGTPADPVVWPHAPWDDRLAFAPDGRVTILTRRTDGIAQPYAVTRHPDLGWTRANRTGVGAPQHFLHLSGTAPGGVPELQEVPLRPVR